MTSQTEPLLRIEELTVQFESGSYPIRDLDLLVRRGEAVGLVGESGSGKTMTVLAILGLLPPGARLSAKSLWFDGLELSGLSGREMQQIRGSAVGYIPQDPLAALNPVLTVGDQITEPLRMHQERKSRLGRATLEVLRGYGLPIGSGSAYKQATEMLGHVGIRDPAIRARQRPHQFSGGMRQRAIISSALALKPRFVIADEPTTALDATIEAQILDLLKLLRSEGGMALLLVSHDLNVVSWNCDYAYVLYQGRLLEEGAVSELFENTRQPYTASLIAASPDLDQAPARVEKPAVRQRSSQGCPFAARCPNVLDVCWNSFPAKTQVGERHAFWCHNPL